MFSNHVIIETEQNRTIPNYNESLFIEINFDKDIIVMTNNKA